MTRRHYCALPRQFIHFIHGQFVSPIQNRLSLPLIFFISISLTNKRCLLSRADGNNVEHIITDLLRHTDYTDSHINFKFCAVILHFSLYILRFNTLLPASTTAALSILYFAKSSSGLPLSPKVFCMPTISTGTG